MVVTTTDFKMLRILKSNCNQHENLRAAGRFSCGNGNEARRSQPATRAAR
jgi:hypothetical protein